MKPSVAAAFPAFTASFEGRTTWMYLDVKCLVTTAVGNLVDPIEYAMPLPWKLPDGSRASAGAITDAWNTVKAARSLARLGGGAFAGLTKLRLSASDVDSLVMAKMRSNDLVLSARFSFFDALPADAQLALHSLAWACGPDFVFPKLESALAARDWATCAEECQMDATGNPGLVVRNVADRRLFLSAASGNPELVNGWGPSPLPSEVDTQPDLEVLGPTSPALVPGAGGQGG